MDHAIFSLSFPNSPEPPQDVFGLWQPALDPGAQPDVGSIWRADLPADPADAFDLLEVRQEELDQEQRALPVAEQRLSADLREIGQAGAGGASFAIGFMEAAGSEQPGGPRSILAAALQHQGMGVSFGLFDNARIDPFQLEETARGASRFADQVRRMVDQLALVETSVAGQKLGLTRAAWSGDMETWWAAGAGRDAHLEHGKVLAQALATRQAWLRFLLVTASGITRVAAALATGPFSLISVWTTWNYVQEVMKEYQKASAQSRLFLQG